MSIAYSGISGRIGYFINKYRSPTSNLLDRSVFSWEDISTYKSLSSYSRLFLSFPVNKINILNLLPKMLSCVRSDQTIVKFGSLGPQRVIHDIIDAELRQKCQLISLQLAPTMQNIIDEQIDGEYLCDYRYGRPAPYVAPEDAAKLAVQAVEHKVTRDILSVTGSENLTIRQIQNSLARYQSYKLRSIDAGAFQDQYCCYPDTISKQVSQCYDHYKTWNPEPSTDLLDNNIVPQTFDQWLEKYYAN
jgi:hypothetical protein